MRHWFSCAVMGSLFAFSVCLADSTLISGADELVAQGDFKGASRELTEALRSKSLSPISFKAIEFELDRLERIRKDYPFTKDGLFAAAVKSVRDLTREEFEQWIAEGRFDVREIDGERKFMVSRNPSTRARISTS